MLGRKRGNKMKIIKDFKDGDFKSLILKQKIVEIYGFKCLAVGYFKKGLIWECSKYLYFPCTILGEEYENYTLSSQVDSNFYHDFYTKAVKEGCEMCDIFLVTDTPNGASEKLRGEFVIFTKDKFFVIDREYIKLEKYEEPYLKYYIDYRYLKE